MVQEELNIYQLMVLRTLQREGWSSELLEYLLTRCGCTQADWNTLVRLELVVERNKGGTSQRWRITAEGLKEYQRQKVGKWF